MIKVLSPYRPRYVCPCCGYEGFFIDVYNRYTGKRKSGKCAGCGSKERHRLEKLVLDRLEAQTPGIYRGKTLLHFAPETYIRDYIQQRVHRYLPSSLSGKFEHRFDITHIDLPDRCVDIVIANHVLEHVQEDNKAVSEIRRVLRPGGFAMLPVPINAESTIEYGQPLESGGHFRAPGMDYFDRYRNIFSRVDLYSSLDFDNKFQCSLQEKRTHWPTRRAPLLKAMAGTLFPEVIPVCYK